MTSIYTLMCAIIITFFFNLIVILALSYNPRDFTKVVPKYPPARKVAGMRIVTKRRKKARQDNTFSLPAQSAEDRRRDAKFRNLGSLPKELRLLIWGFAAPEPATIRQFFKTVKGVRVARVSRPSISLLHACPESRHEYLATDLNEPGVISRRRDHPVYKLYRHTTPIDRRVKDYYGFFACPDFDTFWSSWGLACEYTINSRYGLSFEHLTPLPLISSSVLADIKHLTVSYDQFIGSWVNSLLVKRSSLETVVVILECNWFCEYALGVASSAEEVFFKECDHDKAFHSVWFHYGNGPQIYSVRGRQFEQRVQNIQITWRRLHTNNRPLRFYAKLQSELLAENGNDASFSINPLCHVYL